MSNPFRTRIQALLDGGVPREAIFDQLIRPELEAVGAVTSAGFASFVCALVRDEIRRMMRSGVRREQQHYRSLRDRREVIARICEGDEAALDSVLSAELAILDSRLARSAKKLAAAPVFGYRGYGFEIAWADLTLAEADRLLTRARAFSDGIVRELLAPLQNAVALLRENPDRRLGEIADWQSRVFGASTQVA